MAAIIKIDTPEEQLQMIVFLRDGIVPAGYSSSAASNFRRKAANFSLVGGQLYLADRGITKRYFCVFEETAKREYIRACHLPGHIGINKLRVLISRQACGILSTEIKEFIRRCERCQFVEPLVTRMPLRNIISTGKMQRIQADTIDLTLYAEHNNGKKYVCNIIDCYSKYAWAFPVERRSGEVYEDIFRTLFRLEGAPAILQTDNGREFNNQLLKNLCIEFNILLVFGRVRHPQSQGQVERFNQTLKRRLTKAAGEELGWLSQIDEVVYQYNLTEHRATKRTPFMLHRGFPGVRNYIDDTELLLSPEQESDELAVHHSAYIQRMNSNADANYNTRTLRVDDAVLLRRDFDMNTSTRRRPLSYIYETTIYRISALDGRNATIEANGISMVVDVSRIKKFNE